MSSELKKKMGRPYLGTQELKMRLHPSVLSKLDDYASTHGGNRQAAVKSLLNIALYHVETAQHQR